MRIEIKDKKNFIQMFNILFKKHSINKINGISIDSRMIKKNDIYIPIKGKFNNGHDYIKNAIEAGAIKCFSEKTEKDKKIINITSSIDTINKMASTWNNRSKHKIIGITGSNGKTMTKDLLHHVISKKYTCSKSIGNYNSKIGLPLSYLNSNNEEDYCIVEYGANQIDEIKYLCEIIKPDYSLITNISKAHIKNFKTIKNILLTKQAIFLSLFKKDLAFFNLDDKYISKIKLQCKKITYSFKNNAHYIAKKRRTENKYILEINDKNITIPDDLLHLESTILSVYAISRELGIAHNDFNKYIDSFNLPLGRGEKIEIKKDVNIINDCYNANPSSVSLAIQRFKSLFTHGRKIFIFADMHELGSHSKREHVKIGKKLDDISFDIILTFGKFSHHTFLSIKNISIQKKHFNTMNNLERYFKKIIKKGDLIYLKGSRSMKLERLYKKTK